MWVVYSLIGILAIAVQTVSAQEMRRDTLCMSVYFAPGFSSVTSESELYRLDSLADRLQSLCAAADGRISGILVKGWTSPEGADRLNERLSESRARGVVRYLADRAGSSRLVARGRGRRGGLAASCRGGFRMPGSSGPRGGAPHSRKYARLGGPQRSGSGWPQTPPGDAPWRNPV